MPISALLSDPSCLLSSRKPQIQLSISFLHFNLVLGQALRKSVENYSAAKISQKNQS